MKTSKVIAPYHRRFVKIGKNYYALRTILSIKQVPARKGKDSIVRNWVVTVSRDLIDKDDPDCYRFIWASDEEIADLLTVMTKETNEV